MSDRSRSVARLLFLGGQRIEIGNDVVTPEAERLFAMVVRLSVPLGRLVGRQTMLDTLWPGADDLNARHNLRQTVYKARELGLVVESGEDGLRLDPRHWSCDWEDPEGDVPGDWLPHYDPAFSDDLRAWVAAQRFGVHAGLRPRLMRSLQRARAAGELGAADGYARQLLSFDELNEEATLVRAELLAMQGSKVDALRLLDAYVREMGQLGSGKEAALPAQLLRRRIAEKLPTTIYSRANAHAGRFVSRKEEHKACCELVIDARAGRGRALRLIGAIGAGKSRLVHEAHKFATLQGVRTLGINQTQTFGQQSFSVLRAIVTRLLDQPGALGVAPDALAEIRSWVITNTKSLGECPLHPIEDLFAAVSEESPALITVELDRKGDPASLEALAYTYRRGTPRQHSIIVTSHVEGDSGSEEVYATLGHCIRLQPLSLADIITLLADHAEREQPRATQDQIKCAAIFSEGVPMYGLEMLGLLLDDSSPDTIPWRVREAVEITLEKFSELHILMLALGEFLGPCAPQHILTGALPSGQDAAVQALHELETAGLITPAETGLRISPLMSTAATRLAKPARSRPVYAAAGRLLIEDWTRSGNGQDLLRAIRLLITAREELAAVREIDNHAAMLARRVASRTLTFELTRLRKEANSPQLRSALDSFVDQIRSGAESRRQVRRDRDEARPSSLPFVSRATNEVEHTLVTDTAFQSAIEQARNLTEAPQVRMSEAVMAMCIASNSGSIEGLKTAFECVNAVRDSQCVAQFDLYRADLIFYASLGMREDAIRSAHGLAAEASSYPDVQMACKGLRNSAEVLSVFGDISSARRLLLEARGIATELEYFTQLAWTDLFLADLALEEMLLDESDRYVRHTAALVDKHALAIPLLVADLNIQRCWNSVVVGDYTTASKAARLVSKLLSRTRGTPQWAALSTRLASSRPTRFGDESPEFRALKASIGTQHFYPGETKSLAALTLASRASQSHEPTKIFVRGELSRLAKSGRPVWPFLATISQFSG